MMGVEDPRVRDLQQLAWNVQGRSNKPGGRLPESYRHSVSRFTSRVVAMCADAPYMAEVDFLERAKTATRELEAKKAEITQLEAEIEKEREGNCFRAAAGGSTYVVGKRCTPESAGGGDGSGEVFTLPPTRQGGERTLTAGEVTARCADDPEELQLCDVGLGDSSIEALCEGLRAGGAQLRVLDLSHNCISDAGVQRLVSALAARALCPQLSELWLGGNAFGKLGSDMLVSGLGALRPRLVIHSMPGSRDVATDVAIVDAAIVAGDCGGDDGAGFEAAALPTGAGAVGFAATPGVDGFATAGRSASGDDVAAVAHSMAGNQGARADAVTGVAAAPADAPCSGVNQVAGAVETVLDERPAAAASSGSGGSTAARTCDFSGGLDTCD
eukprot:NODE_9406_length_1426_cov_8.027714.p1 GENE.NODE_9406_length_1426_cov_8.027714~~NODE_9406_length_1426_cov_8.027714.p1  ORF type:complete len:385 (+),score=132.95 NODE_9406_length_1426_cov_8.027714:147-1301(+)